MTIPPPPEDVGAYYAQKYSEYEVKYGNGPFTSVHPGLYFRESFPFLYRNVDLALLGPTALRSLLVSGQINLIRKVAGLLPAELYSFGDQVSALDCGAGHGGTTLWLALSYGWRVHALVLSEDQGEHIRGWASRLGIAHLVTVEVADLHESTVRRPKYDVVLAVDSMCQIGRWRSSVELLYGALNSAGHMIIADYFIVNPSDAFRGYFDSYWKACISEASIAEEFARSKTGQIIDVTAHQLPFWALSQAYSHTQLETQTLAPQKADRLANSIKFHQQMHKMYSSGGIVYLIVSVRAER